MNVPMLDNHNVKHILTFTLLLWFNLVVAQDKLIFINGDTIEAKISEVGIDRVSYKEIDFIDGPNRIVSVTELSKVVFKNGNEEKFDRPNFNNTDPSSDKRVLQNTLVASAGVSWWVGDYDRNRLLAGYSVSLDYRKELKKSLVLTTFFEHSQGRTSHERNSEVINRQNRMVAYRLGTMAGWFYKGEGFKMPVVSPFGSIGVGISIHQYELLSDLQTNYSGSIFEYHIWDDGRIFNQPQSVVVSSDLVQLHRDYEYETLLTASRLNSVAVSVPHELGLHFRVLDVFGLHIIQKGFFDVVLYDEGNGLQNRIIYSFSTCAGMSFSF